MSAASAAGQARRGLERVGTTRLLAVAGGAVLTLTYLEVLFRAIDVAGADITTAHLLSAVLGALGLAVLVSRVLAPRRAVALGAVLLAAGLVGYLLSVPLGPADVGGLLDDTAALLTGLSILQVTRADVWALGLAPAPVFLTAYFFLRRSYAPGVLTGGLTLALFVLTGDAGTVQALVGVLGAAAAVGLGDIERGPASPSLTNTLVVVLVGMLVVTTSVSLVPGGEARPLLAGGGASTVEASLTESTARVGVAGSIRLSPQVRFTVAAEEGRFWRVGAFDRYTGDGWVRTGQTRPYDGRLPGPATGDVDRVRQRFRAESAVGTMPAAWKPVSVDAPEGSVEVTALGGLQPTGSLEAGETYTVTSLVGRPTPERLRRAGTDYPAVVEERYLQLPESTPDRLGRFTTELTASAETPYEQAQVIEAWLEEDKLYALDVGARPEGDVASAFVFGMDRGYCVYYATAMVAMLRTQGVPARFVVGYTTGQAVEDDRWVVRGLDSHAWVEVYFPGSGWVRFDPTPAAPRQATEIRRIERARENGEPDVDTGESLAVPITTAAPATANDTAFPEVTDEDAISLAGGNLSENETGLGGVGSDAGGLPTSPEALLYGFVLLLGAATAVVRLGVGERLYRRLWLRRLPAGTPTERVLAAVERAEYLLGRRHRPRRTGETRRDYLRALAGGVGGPDDGRVEALLELGERARYGGRATEADAARAARLLRELRAGPEAAA